MAQGGAARGADETPVVSQYLSLKRQHPDDVLFFRLGDFYEMFNEDAVEVSRILNLTLTHRGGAPMCGVPYRAANSYIARLLRAGKKIAVAEQVSEPGKSALTDRRVVEVITPGTALESEWLDGAGNNFLAAFSVTQGFVSFAYVDVTTGEFFATKFAESSLSEGLAKELGRASPRELIVPEGLRADSAVRTVLEAFPAMSVSYYPDWHFGREKTYRALLDHFKSANLAAFSLSRESPEVSAAGFLLEYIEKTLGSAASHISDIRVYDDSRFVVLDDSSRRNLEVFSNLRDGSASYSLLETVSNTRTAGGTRLLRSWLSFPLTNVREIRAREDSVELFTKDSALLKRVRGALGSILDVERLAGRIATDRAHAKDLQALRASLIAWGGVQKLVSKYDFSFLDAEQAGEIVSLIGRSILDDPATAFGEGRIIREGWNGELDRWRRVHDDFSSVLREYEEEERAKNGIPNLRIKSTGSMGYYIEVTRGKLDKVPEHFIRRRSLLNAERYTTRRLQELESSLNESSSRMLELERDLFLDVRGRLKQYVPYLLQTAKEIAYVDVTSSFADLAMRYDWVRPEVAEGSLEFSVEGGRHPVVERHIPRGEFVPNDLTLCGAGGKTFALITGPNMAGKSTFLRQNALIALLAQTGCFVPARRAKLGIVDRIFCRVGASDNLARGESTFLVEMTETARILRSATEKSFVVMDEVGRGTGTGDGRAIAWAVSEYLLNNVRCKTLFATHYHELSRLEHKALCFLCMAVSQNGADIVFLRKVKPGVSENSYGIHVARLAGVPESVVARAQEVLERLQREEPAVIPEERSAENAPPDDIPAEDAGARQTGEHGEPGMQRGLFSKEELAASAISSCDIDNMTPLQALKMLSDLKDSLSN